MADKEVYGGADHMDFFKVGDSGASYVTKEIMQDGGEYVEEIDAASVDGIENEEEPFFDVEDLHSDVDDQIVEAFLRKRENRKKNLEKKKEKIRKGKAVATSSNMENHNEKQDRREIHSGFDDDDLSAESDDNEDELYIPSDDPGDYFDQSNDESNDENEPFYILTSQVLNRSQ
ncbi:hypothetical protein SLEP1_g44792 [Rubroshorea leprosula]|uniref:Uncharacterized protein n=1 Tax=Rubroshorea leprosula TaxID=152421 RepID=A0AAV5LHS6_9ROSI|nr:hypothetical protein SLEP1_g44792 [Rubroshorea leprosula]